MRRPRMLLAAVAVPLLALGFMLPTGAVKADTASADGAQSSTAAAAPPPACVQTDLDDGRLSDTLTVINGCGSTVRVKVVLAFATDKSCTTLGPGEEAEFSWGFPGRFDRLDTC